MVKSLDRLVNGHRNTDHTYWHHPDDTAVVHYGDSFRSSVIAMVAAVLGMIPEGLYMMASIAMVVSAVRLAKIDVLVQNMRCIETLASVDVLCVDKTGHHHGKSHGSGRFSRP
jgi:magnesium-transporting ATPase (P-type)